MTASLSTYHLAVYIFKKDQLVSTVGSKSHFSGHLILFYIVLMAARFLYCSGSWQHDEGNRIRDKPLDCEECGCNQWQG